jgi:hypothetical protein
MGIGQLPNLMKIRQFVQQLLSDINGAIVTVPYFFFENKVVENRNLIKLNSDSRIVILT